MRPKTYRAATMADALSEVKRDMGRDAVILQTRHVRKGGLLGVLSGRRMWEVVASPHLNVPHRLSEGTYVPMGSPVAESAQVFAEPPAGSRAPAISPATLRVSAGSLVPAAAAPAGCDEPVGRKVAELHTMISALLHRQKDDPLPAELRESREMLRSQEVDDELADSIIGQLRLQLTGEQLADRACIAGELHKRVAAHIVTVGRDVPAPDGRRVIALIGPTGVGKTTTIAKLAADFKLRQGKRVAMVTLDTYRIAAVDQLRTYADIIEVPVRAVLSPGELNHAVNSMADADVVLIDTAGRSQNDRLRLNQLRSFLNGTGIDEVHLVVSATTNRAGMKRIAENFAPLGANRIIMTKLDEAETFGVILNIASAARVPLSYVTTGQDVPDDITPADADKLAWWVLKGVANAC